MRPERRPPNRPTPAPYAVNAVTGWVSAPSEGEWYSAEATALFARFTTPPTLTRKALINNLIVSLINAGVWGKLDALYVLAAANSQAARQNWMADQYNLTAVASPVFATDRGYTGDGSSSYLLTGFNPSAAISPKLVQDSAHASVWSRTDLNSGTAVDIGAGRLVINSRSTAANTIRGQVCDATNGNFGAVANSLGLSVLSRDGAAVRTGYRDASTVGNDAQASTGTVTSEIVLLAGSPVLNFSTRQIAVSSIGAALTAPNVASLYAALTTYLTAVGAV